MRQIAWCCNSIFRMCCCLFSWFLKYNNNNYTFTWPLTKCILCLFCWHSVRSDCSLLTAEGWLVCSNFCLWVPVLWPVEKYMETLLKKHGGPSSQGLPVSRYYLCSLCHQCSFHCLPRNHNTKHSGRQCTRSKDGRESQYQLCSECHYLCSAYWEAPRASTRACCMYCHAVGCLSMHFQGQHWKCAIEAQRWKTIISIGHQLMFFSQWWEKEGERERETAMTFKIHRRETLPLGLSRSLQPEDNIMQFVV